MLLDLFTSNSVLESFKFLWCFIKISWSVMRTMEGRLPGMAGFGRTRELDTLTLWDGLLLREEREVRTLSHYKCSATATHTDGISVCLWFCPSVCQWVWVFVCIMWLLLPPHYLPGPGTDLSVLSPCSLRMISGVIPSVDLAGTWTSAHSGIPGGSDLLCLLIFKSF